MKQLGAICLATTLLSGCLAVEDGSGPAALIDDPRAVSFSEACPATAPEPMKSGIFVLTKEFRKKSGLPPLNTSPPLDRAAQIHACDMAIRGFFDHTGSDGSTAMVRVRGSGYNACLAAENIAYGQRSSQEVVSGWIASPGHQRNILNSRATDIGIGHVPAGNGRSAQFVQVFATEC